MPRLKALAGPLLAELALGLAVSAAGTALAASNSDAAGAAFGLSVQIFGMLFVLFRVIGAGISVVVAQALGAARRDEADTVARAALGASSGIGLATGLVCLVLAGPLLRALNAPAGVLPLAEPLLMALAPALLLDAWNASMASVLRAHLRSREVLAVVVSMHLLHLAGALALMPLLGLPGFALALVASRLFGVAWHLGLWQRQLRLTVTASDFWRWRAGPLVAVLRIGLPGAAENIAYRLAATAAVAAAGALGTEALATQAYVIQFNNFALLAGLATGLSVEIVVGHLVGAGAFKRADALVRRALAIGLGLSVGVATLFALAGGPLLRWFTTDPAIVSAGIGLLWWSVLLEPGRTFNLVVINALRAAGDARFPVAAGALSMALVLGAGSWWLAHGLGLGLTGIWIAYAADEWLRGLIMWARWRQLHWLPHARRSQRRLACLRSNDSRR